MSRYRGAVAEPVVGPDIGGLHLDDLGTLEKRLAELADFAALRCGHSPLSAEPFEVSIRKHIEELEELLRECDAKIIFEHAVRDGTGQELQERIEAALGFGLEK